MEKLVERGFLSPWGGGHNDVCETCDSGGRLLRCSFCNLAFHNRQGCLGGGDALTAVRGLMPLRLGAVPEGCA